MAIIKRTGFLKADEIKGGEEIKFLDAGTEKESKFKDEKTGKAKMQLNFKIDLDGSERFITANKTSQNFLADAFGDNTEKWVGQKATLNKAMTPQGKDMIILKPVL